ncbi:MAG: phosphomannomutase/phosphoglucomutase [Candidatus Altiarchaeota archaeon]|nr:phosphomannomutase/phosphoglucomutase [Candidatus Altiarchaeota archaeon]
MTVFRAYDIRGVYGSEITESLAESIGKAFGSTLKGTVVVARDNRLSGESLSKSLADGILSTGANVVDIGIVPTPLAYFAANRWEHANCVMVTASHNPSEYNGFKFVRNYGALSGEEIQELRKLIESGKYRTGRGTLSAKDAVPEYDAYLKARIKPKRPLKVVMDSGNGVAGLVAPGLFRALGCEVVELYSEPDGNFPNHHPDPTVDDNMKDLINAVQKEKADFGIGFDGDVDRAGFIDDKGRILRGDQALILFAREILKKHKKAKIIYEVKCSQAVEEEILKDGGIPILYRTGHSFIKKKLKEEHALLAGEMSGHFYFADGYYGFDDAIYAAAKMAELLSNTRKKLSELVDEMPQYYSTPEIRIECPDERKFQIVEEVSAEFQKTNKVNTIDGARIQFKDGWGLIRASNTQPALILRMESKTKKGLEEIKAEIEKEVKKHLN